VGYFFGSGFGPAEPADAGAVLGEEGVVAEVLVGGKVGMDHAFGIYNFIRNKTAPVGRVSSRGASLAQKRSGLGLRKGSWIRDDSRMVSGQEAMDQQAKSGSWASGLASFDSNPYFSSIEHG